MTIWNFTNYRDYLKFRLGDENKRTGLRKKMASKIGVHTTFVSQVMSGSMNFSLEQAEAINEFLEHTKKEGEYFLLLVIKDRAGTPSLKNRFEQQIEDLQKERLNIADKIKPQDKISKDDRERFYSTYHYGALHILSSIQKFRQKDILARTLNVSMDQLNDMIEFLVELKILIQKDSEIVPGPNHIHLESDPYNLRKHHTNWRLHSINSLNFLDRNDVHYSACVSLSLDDVLTIKDSLLENLKRNVDVISKSKEETAYVYNLDFYKMV